MAKGAILAAAPVLTVRVATAHEVKVGAGTALYRDWREGLPEAIGVPVTDHDMDLAFRFVQGVMAMVSGEIIAESTKREIAADPQVQSAYLGQSAHG
jgi:ABC-type uncharacterized transport system ATPase subunit